MKTSDSRISRESENIRDFVEAARRRARQQLVDAGAGPNSLDHDKRQTSTTVANCGTCDVK